MRPSSADTSEPACTKRKILSMKSSTSRCSSSRKYSATVKPVNPTRRRAPGGSVICPKISAQRDFSEFPATTTPDSCNHPHAAVLHSYVVNQFLNQHGFSYPRATDQSNLSALQVRLD